MHIGDSQGLLYYGQLGDAVKAELPEYKESDVANTDQKLLAALYRDYTFLASAYLLEVRFIVGWWGGGPLLRARRGPNEPNPCCFPWTCYRL